MLYDVIEGRGVLGSGVETSGLGGSRLLEGICKVTI